MAPLALADLAAFVFACVCIAFLYAWLQTGGALIKWLIGNIPDITIGAFGVGVKPFQWLIDDLTGFDTFVQNIFYFWLGAAKGAWTVWVAQCAAFASAVTEDYGFLAGETGRALKLLRRSVIPAVVGIAVQGVERPLKWALSGVARDQASAERELRQAVATLERAAKAAEHTTAGELRRVEETAKAAGAHAIAVTLPGIHGLEHDYSGLREWIRTNARKLTAAGIVGLVAAALNELGLSSQRCSNNKKLSKGICGVVPKVLDDLLEGLIAVIGTTSLLTLAEVYQGLFIEVASDAIHFWRADLNHEPGNPVLGATGFGGNYTIPVAPAGRNPGLGVAGV
jgi:hypothetical protein